MPISEEALAALLRRVDALEAESAIRKIQARYMFLCDTPLPEYGVADDMARIDLIMQLYTQDAIWEGVGEYYDGQFGRSAGREQVIEHFQGFWEAGREPGLILNAHYLTTEQIHVHDDGETADGEWIHMQPWLFTDGTALLRSSRLHNGFRKEGDAWKISRYRTENVFVAPLRDNFASDYPTRSVLMSK